MEQATTPEHTQAVLFQLDSRPWRQYDCAAVLENVCWDYRGVRSYAPQPALSKGEMRLALLEEKTKHLALSG
eukprot:453807-Pelagomonas_calceolata.AAC.2